MAVPAQTITIGVNLSGLDQNASATVAGIIQEQVVGTPVIQGPPGNTGAAATVLVGTTETGSPGTDADVVNVGSTTDAVLNFTIPRGATGATGPEGPPGSDAEGSATRLFVAASTASSKVKAIADYVCDGTADQVQILSALAALPSDGGIVELSYGTFNITSQIAWAAHGVHLVGQGQDATKIVNSTGSANFDMIKIGNRQVDGIMRNSCSIENLTVSQAGGASTKACIWVDGGGRGSCVKNVRTNEGGNGGRFTDLDRYIIDNLDVNNVRSVGVQYEVGAEGTFGKVLMMNSSMNLSDTNSICFKAMSLTSSNPFDSLIFQNNLFFSTSNVSGTIGAQFTLAAVDTLFIGGQFESPSLAHVDINTSNDSRINFKSVSFIQNGTAATTSGIRMDGANHALTIDTCVFQKIVNVFNAVGQFPNLEFIGWNKNNGTITNIFNGSFGLRHGTDTAFVGNGALYLGTDNERYENAFLNQLRIHNGSPTSGKVWTATDTDGNGTWSTPLTGISRSIASVSTNTTAGATAGTDYVYFVTASATYTMPTAVGNTNRYSWTNTSAVNITIGTTSSQTINGSTSITLIPNQSVDLISNNSNWSIF